jgi:hypothetical protein
MDFKVIGEIRDVETIATGGGIRELKLLRKRYGAKRWRKRKGVAKVEVHGQRRLAELHWYEGHGVGKVLIKIKRFISES